MRRVLVVDDEPDIREVAGLALSAVAGWDVRTAGSGADALEAATADPPEAIVLDVMMPGMDGPATLAQLQARPATAGIPVVMLTAKVQASELERLRSLGAAGVLTKPFDPMTLGAQVSAILGWS